MHVRLYKDMIISPEQRQRMAAYWLQWKRSRRRLDALLDTACEHLECLPVHLDLPPAFISHLSCLCESPQTVSSRKLHDSTMHDVNTCPASGGSADVSREVSPQPLLGKAVDVLECTPRFLGQSGEDMAQGNGAVQVLRDMHMQDRDLYVDTLGAQMPGVFVNSVQVKNSCLCLLSFPE